MTKTIQCDIVSAHKEIFSGEATMVFASGIAGELEVAEAQTQLAQAAAQLAALESLRKKAKR